MKLSQFVGIACVPALTKHTCNKVMLRHGHTLKSNNTDQDPNHYNKFQHIPAVCILLNVLLRS